MNCQEIEKMLNELKVDSLGRIRNKSKVMDKIHAKHLSDLDSELMDVRIFVARLSTGHTSTECLKMIDEFLYQKQIN